MTMPRGDSSSPRPEGALLLKRSLRSRRTGLNAGSCRRPIAAKRLQHFVQVVGHLNFVVKEILQPDEVHPLGHGHERQQFAETDADARLRHVRLATFRGGVDAELTAGHSRTSLRWGRDGVGYR